MGNLLSLPPDRRPSAIYLIAHQGPLKRPVPIEIQHMRIRRYMDLLNEENHGQYYANDTDHVYVDLNYLGSGQFPALMRLGEAIGQKVYRAVFADFHGPYDSPTEGESLVFSARHILEQLPVEFIDVNDDPKGVLKKRLEQWNPAYAERILFDLNPGHELITFFPGLAALVLRAAFFREMKSRCPDDICRKIDSLEHENPYSSRRIPFIDDQLLYYYYELHREDQERDRDRRRRSEGEKTFRLEPDGKPCLIEEGLQSGDTLGTPEQVAEGEVRLEQFGFSRVVDGSVVSFERQYEGFRLFGDPRPATGVRISAFVIGKPKGKQKRVGWEAVPSGDFMVKPNWWKANPKAKFEEYLAKKLGGTDK